MIYSDFEKVRKRYFPIYLTFLIIAFVVMLAAIVFFVFMKLNIVWWQFLIAVIGTIILIFGLIFSADAVEKRYLKKYNPIFQKEVVYPIIEDAFDNLKTNEKRTLDLSKVELIGKVHKYKILNEIHATNYSIYEISMLKDLRFRGYIIVKPLDKYRQPFLLTNYNYYFKPRIKHYRINSGNENFDNRFMLYSSIQEYQMPSKLAEKLYNKLSTFKHVGVMIKDNTAYYVLGDKPSFQGASLLNLSLTEPIEEGIEMKIKIFVQKLQSIAEYNFD